MAPREFSDCLCQRTFRHAELILEDSQRFYAGFTRRELIFPQNNRNARTAGIGALHLRFETAPSRMLQDAQTLVAQRFGDPECRALRAGTMIDEVDRRLGYRLGLPVQFK